MYSIKDITLVINSRHVEFHFNIRVAVEYFDSVIILLNIPFTEDDINNIYCVNALGKVVWQSEDLNLLYPNVRNLPYEQMGIRDNILHASDFYGRSYSINLDNGKIKDCKMLR